MRRTVRLGELCILRAGSAFPQDQQGGKGGSPFIKVSDLSQPAGGKWVVDANNYITEAQARRLKVRLMPPCSVVFAKIGEGLKSERLRVLSVPTAIDNNLMAATAIESSCSPDYLYYLLATVGLSKFAHGSALPYLRQSDLESIECDVPPLPTQRAIAEVLGALDDKIAANASVVSSCDRLRRLKYDAMLGLEQVPLSSLARFVNGRAYTKNSSGSGRVVIRIAELNSGIGGSTVFNDIEVPDDNLAREGDLLFAWSGSLTVARWYRPEAIINQHIFKVIPTGEWPMWLVACATERKLEDFKAIAADKATTMGHIQRHHLDQLVGVPAASATAAHDEAMRALWGRALAAEVESLHLAELRDTLLPHLMSGRLTVREAEKQVEAAL